MSDDWTKRIEEQNDFKIKNNTDNFAENTFRSDGSAGNNNDRLARIMAAYELAMDILKWDKPLSQIVTSYQASLNAKYHDDFVRISVAERVSVLMKRSIATKDNKGNESFYG